MGQVERVLRPDGSSLERFGFELRRWRKRAGLSQARLAALVHVSADLVQKIEVGKRRPSYELARDSDALLGARGGLVGAWREISEVSRELRAGRRGSNRGNAGSGISQLDDILGGAGETLNNIGSLASFFASYSSGEVPGQDGLCDIATLTIGVEHARRAYQACRYSELTGQLPDLLARLDAACRSADGASGNRPWVLSADAYHVAAGLLLKLGEQGLAYLAADRSMRAAQASEDCVPIGASARIITHALMDGGHLGAAVTTASSQAERLDRDAPARTPEVLSVYGSLLLRGAIAASADGKRATAHELLAEAHSAAEQLGADGNLLWTAFGPTNVRLHHVNVAVTLGDAGTAVDVARGIDLSAITVAERKASLLVDLCRAFVQWGRFDKAYAAIRAAEEVAPEEVARRPSVRGLVRELACTAPPAVRREAAGFAARIGASS